MPTLTLGFTLPEEKDECECALHGVDYSNAICDFANLLRRTEKEDHDSQFTTAVTYLKARFYEILADNGVEL